MNTVEQGRVGEASIVAHFVKEGYHVYLPQFGNTESDMIVQKDSVLYRVECKSTRSVAPSGAYTVQLKKVRHNKTANINTYFDASKVDLLAIYIVPLDEVRILHASEQDGKSAVTIR